MDPDTIRKTLNQLLETSRDGEYGFRSCSEHVKSPTLREAMQRQAGECQQGAIELAALVRQFGGEPDEGGSLRGALHRGWVSARAALSTATDQAMVEECERGEDAAVARYREALQQDLPPAVRSLIERQFDGVRRNHDEVRRWRQSVAGNST